MKQIHCLSKSAAPPTKVQLQRVSSTHPVSSAARAKVPKVLNSKRVVTRSFLQKRPPTPPDGGTIKQQPAVVTRRMRSHCRLLDIPVPGTLNLCRPPSPSRDPLIANLYARVYKGSKKNPNVGGNSECIKRLLMLADTVENRIEWFRISLSTLLDKISEEGITKVAFPHRIGCGHKYDHWKTYYMPTIDEFAKRAKERGVKTQIVMNY